MAEQNNTQQQPQQAPIKKKPLFTIEALDAILKANGISVRRNKITNEDEISANLNSDCFLQEKDLKYLSENLVALVYSYAADDYKFCNQSVIISYVKSLASRNSYNPVLEYLSSIQWDGTDRLQQVYDILGIASKDQLSRTLIHLWLKQGIALLHNTESEHLVKSESMLILHGDQGIGKTRFFRKLAIFPDKEAWFLGEQEIRAFDKDYKRRALTTWISEFGEVDKCFSVINASDLKTLVSTATDKYRLPYGHTDITRPRCTLLAGTTNESNFLVDPTGNRRFWIIDITKKKITQQELDALDVSQLWAQIYSEVAPLFQDVNALAACFCPDDKTRKQLDARNSGHKASAAFEIELRDIFTVAERNPEIWPYKWTTLSEWKIKFPTIRNASGETLGKRINEFIGAHEYKIKAKRTGKNGREYFLPVFESPENA